MSNVTGSPKANDPTLDEMIEYLKESTQDYDADDIDVAEAIYWFACEYHNGQASNLYSALSQSQYKPGPLAKGPSGFAAIELYHELIGAYIDPAYSQTHLDEEDANNLLQTIQELLSGKQWGTDTLQEIALVMRAAGYEIKDYSGE